MGGPLMNKRLELTRFFCGLLGQWCSQGWVVFEALIQILVGWLDESFPRVYNNLGCGLWPNNNYLASEVLQDQWDKFAAIGQCHLACRVYENLSMNITHITSFSVYVTWVNPELCAMAKALISRANVILISKSLYFYFEWRSYFCPFYI